jgi:transposase
MWNVAELDAEYIKRMEDVLRLYARAYDPKRPVVCLDERPVVLHEDKRPSSAARPGREARYDYEYVRRGTANLFCAVEPKAGRHFTKATADRGGAEFTIMLLDLSEQYRDAKTIHLVMDNLSTHRRTSVERFLGSELGSWLWRRFKVHYTPKHGSWLNMAEMEISLCNRQCLGRRRISTLKQLARETRSWNRDINRRRVRIHWTFTPRKARVKFGYKAPKNIRSKD